MRITLNSAALASLLFALPVAAAWSAYFSGWFDDVNTTNKGEWVKPILSFSDVNPVYEDQSEFITKPGEKWKLIFPNNVSNCQVEETDLDCLHNLFVISQTHIALGKNTERVEQILYNGNNDYTDAQLKTLQGRFLDLRIINSSSEAVVEIPNGYIYIADPLGNIMLRYPVVNTREDIPLKGKAILSDFKKLLKLSRLD